MSGAIFNRPGADFAPPMEGTFTKLDPELKARWVEALRSGQYPQARSTLRSEKGYCCLGVLCDLHDPDRWENVGDGAWIYQEASGSLGHSAWTFLPGDLANNYGLGRIQGRLASMNDDGASFAQIADWIEEWL